MWKFKGGNKMIKINVNGNRSDIIGYVSYYSCEEIAELLGIGQEEIIYETTVVDYFLHGDITFDSEIIVKVTITDNYFNYIQELTNIIVKYVGYFTNKCKVYYEIIDSRLVYLYEVKDKKKKNNSDEYSEEKHCCCGHHHHEEHCGCGCEEGHECHCHEEGHECECGEECECHHHECNCEKE